MSLQFYPLKLSSAVKYCEVRSLLEYPVWFGGILSNLAKGKTRKNALLFRRARGIGPNLFLESSRHFGLSPSTQQVPLGTANTPDVAMSVIQSPSSPIILLNSNLFGSSGDLNVHKKTIDRCYKDQNIDLELLSRDDKRLPANLPEKNHITSTIPKKPTYTYLNGAGGEFQYHVPIPSVYFKYLIRIHCTITLYGATESKWKRTEYSNYPSKAHLLTMDRQDLRKATFLHHLLDIGSQRHP